MQCMKPPLRGKYLVTEHAVELRRIISALPIVLADVGAVCREGVSRRHAHRLAGALAWMVRHPVAGR
jgi:hypothetical protein